MLIIADEVIKDIEGKWFIERSGNFMKRLHEFLNIESADLVDILDNRKFSVKDTALTYKLINDWDAKGIINLKQVNEGWRTFSLVELVWIKIVSELRKFGLPLNNIRKLKENIFNLESEYFYRILRMYIYELLNDKKEKEQIFAVITSDNKIEFCTFDEYFNNITTGASTLDENYKRLYMVNTIQINLNKILESILNNVSLRPHFKDYVDLKNPELISLLDIRDSGNKTIFLKLNKGKVLRSEVLEVITTKRGYRDILDELDHQKLVTNKNGPNSVRLERTKKRKFDNSDSK